MIEKVKVVFTKPQALIKSLTKVPNYPSTQILTYLKITDWFKEAHTF